MPSCKIPIFIPKMQYNSLNMNKLEVDPIKVLSTYKMLPFHTIDVLETHVRFFKLIFSIFVT